VDTCQCGCAREEHDERGRCYTCISCVGFQLAVQPDLQTFKAGWDAAFEYVRLQRPEDAQMRAAYAGHVWRVNQPKVA
jgi:hypothetical protein